MHIIVVKGNNIKMIIGLMGFEFTSYNKGCEALTYSFLKLLENIIKDKQNITIYNFSCYEMGNVPEVFEDFNIQRIEFKLKDFKMKYIRSILKCDIIFDITMGDSFSDIYSVEFLKYLIKEKIIVSTLNKRYILLPQTYGPFYDLSLLKRVKKIFNKTTKIYCRDKMSQDYISEIFDITNSELTTDIAFLLPFDKKMYEINSDKIKIGFNISGLLYNGGFNKKNQFNLKLDYKVLVNNLLDFFAENKKFELYLIGHVFNFDKDAIDDDYKVINSLRDKYSNIKIAPEFKTPIEAKSYISNMDFFIGSRMHATIASFSSGVITIPISYSRKFEGLYESIGYSYTINAYELSNDQAFIKIINYLTNHEDIKKCQEKSLCMLLNILSDFEKSLTNLLNNSV